VARRTGWVRFAEGVAQNVVAFIIVSAIIAGVGFLANVLSLLLVGSSLVLASFAIFLAVHLKEQPPPETEISEGGNRVHRGSGHKGLEHVVTVTLDTEVEPFDYRREWFEGGDEIEVEAESEDRTPFHFFVCDKELLAINRRRTVNFVYYEGKEYTRRYRKRLVIPKSGNWYFVAYTPEGERFTTVKLRIDRVRTS
jgi:hypothetical protein